MIVFSNLNPPKLLHHLCKCGSVVWKVWHALIDDLGQWNPLDCLGLLGSVSNAHLRLSLKAHFEKEDSKAIDIHLWRVIIRKSSLWGSIGWVARGNTVDADLLNEVR